MNTHIYKTTFYNAMHKVQKQLIALTCLTVQAPTHTHTNTHTQTHTHTHTHTHTAVSEHSLERCRHIVNTVSMRCFQRDAVFDSCLSSPSHAGFPSFPGNALKQLCGGVCGGVCVSVLW